VTSGLETLGLGEFLLVEKEGGVFWGWGMIIKK
jgi:hypothetical protein